MILLSDKVKLEGAWFSVKPVSTAQYILFCIHWGYFAGLNGVVGHELLHKKERINKVLGTWAYTKFMYSHFLDEHIYGHHKLVATPEDPATARLNESLYEFIPRSVVMGIVNSWKREFRRIRRLHGEKASVFALIILNKMTYFCLLHSAMMLGIYMVLGWSSLKYHLIYSFLATFFLEVINYIEHYGLLRN
jgi:alkane 1-monooxygenase